MSLLPEASHMDGHKWVSTAAVYDPALDEGGIQGPFGTYCVYETCVESTRFDRQTDIQTNMETCQEMLEEFHPRHPSQCSTPSLATRLGDMMTLIQRIRRPRRHADQNRASPPARLHGKAPRRGSTAIGRTPDETGLGPVTATTRIYKRANLQGRPGDQWENCALTKHDPCGYLRRAALRLTFGGAVALRHELGPRGRLLASPRPTGDL